MPPVRSRRAAREARADFERPREAQRHRKKQQRHRRRKNGVLKLESPAEVFARRAEGNQHASKGAEARDNSARVRRSSKHRRLPRRPRSPCDDIIFSPDYGEHAGHEVEYKPRPRTRRKEPAKNPARAPRGSPFSPAPRVFCRHLRAVSRRGSFLKFAAFAAKTGAF